MKPNLVNRPATPTFKEPALGDGARRGINLNGPPTSATTAKAGPSHWSEFWQDFSPRDRPQERCHIPGVARAVVDRHWERCAVRLPRDAQVLDVGCGAGVVGRTLLSYRADLLVSGIDFANVPVPDIRNLAIHPWVSMEELPFGDQSFDAAVSLFGIEYGDIGKTAAELGRVLRPGAKFNFLIHHFESEIVCEGMLRRRGLRELLSPKIRAAFLSGNVAGLDQQLDRLGKQFPAEPSVKLFSKWLRRDVYRCRPERQIGWQNLLNGLGTELLLLAQLERSAKSPIGIGGWLAPLLATMSNVSVSVLRRGSGEPIAWDVSGVR